MIKPVDVVEFVEALEDSEYVESVGRSGPLVTSRFGTGDMATFHWPIADYGFVPISTHWDERRVQWLPKELMME